MIGHHLPWPYPRVLAHRGGGTLAPENTLAALRAGRARGFRGVEFDAMLAADEVPVLMHDDTLARTTNGAGDVAALSAAQLGLLDAGAWHSRTGEVVARETARLYADQVRPGGDQASRIEPRVPLLSSFDGEALRAARAAAPDLPRGFLLDRIPADWPDRLVDVGCVALHTNHRHLSRAQARAVKDAGYWLFCYTINDPARARELFDWGVDAFCTDRIDVIAPDLAPHLGPDTDAGDPPHPR